MKPLLIKPVRKYITVVSGLPRSGTSLMMQMLEAGGMPLLTDGLRAADESNPRGYLEFEPVKRTREDSSWVAGAVGRAVKVVYLLLKGLPPGFEYRVILMRRDMKEVVASQQAMLERMGRVGAGVGPERMEAIFDAEMGGLSEWLSARKNFSVLSPGYRDCIENPALVAGLVNGFLDGGLDTARMAGAAETLLYRHRR